MSGKIILKTLEELVDPKENMTYFCSNPLINDDLFYWILLAPACLISLLLCFTITRKSLFPNFLHGRPGIIQPMDLNTKSKRLPYVCAFGSMTYLFLEILLGNIQLINNSAPFMKGLIAIVTAVVFSIAYLPVFASLTADHALGHGLGASYTLALTVIGLVRLWDCDVHLTTSVLYGIYSAPKIFSCAYLSISSSISFISAMKKKAYFVSLPDIRRMDTHLNNIRDSSDGLHVQRLLSKPPDHEIIPNISVPMKILNFLKKYIYTPSNGFRYSTNVLVTLSTGFVILYQLSFFAAAKLLTLYFRFNVFQKAFPIEIAISGVVLAFMVIGYNILNHLKSYRRDMHKMYRGELNDVFKGLNMSYTRMLVGAINYSSLQIVHISLSFILQVVFCVGALFLIYAILTHIDVIRGLIEFFSPILFWAIAIFIIQRLAVRFVFLQEPKQSVALDNRKMLFMFTYVIYFLNMVLGAIKFVLRLLLNLAIITLLLTGLDQTGFPQKYLFLDIGYNAYLGLLKLDCSQTHPVMRIFIRILKLGAKNRKERELKSQPDSDVSNSSSFRSSSPVGETKGYVAPASKSKRSKAVFRWQLLYTLVNNPSIRLERKGYAHKLRLAREMGLVVPRSDMLIDPFSLCQLVTEMEKENRIASFNKDEDSKHIVSVLLSRIQNQVTRYRSSSSNSNSNSQAGGGGGGGVPPRVGSDGQLLINSPGSDDIIV